MAAADKKISKIKAEQEKRALAEKVGEMVVPGGLLAAPLIEVAEHMKRAQEEKEIKKLEKMAEQPIEEDRQTGTGRGIGEIRGHVGTATDWVTAKAGGGLAYLLFALFLALLVGAALVTYWKGGILIIAAITFSVIFFIVLVSGIDTKSLAAVGFIFLLLFGMIALFQPRLETSWEKTWGAGGIQMAFQRFTDWFRGVDPAAELRAFQEEQKAIAAGDYYQSQVDESTERILGLRMGTLTTDIPEQGIYEGEPFTVYTEIDAETIDPMDVALECITTKKAIGKILQDAAFTVERSASEYFDCEFEFLTAGAHTIQMKAEFGFATLSYLKSYFIDRDSKRALDAKNKDFYETYAITDYTEDAISSPGPVSIGMGLGVQPITLADDARTKTLGITVTNEWEGSIKEIKGLYLLIPKGFEAESRGKSIVTRVGCDALSGVTKEACDETKVSVYQLESDLREPIKTFKPYRVYLKPTSPGVILGTGPYAVHNFKVTADYVYELKQETTVYVKPKEVTEELGVPT